MKLTVKELKAIFKDEPDDVVINIHSKPDSEHVFFDYVSKIKRDQPNP